MEVCVPDHVRLTWSFIKELGLHKVVSPDLKGFCITAPTVAEAEKEAFAVISIFRKHSSGQTSRLAAVDFEAS
jgi:hypothetical protein